jgi:hypothetical protein
LACNFAALGNKPNAITKQEINMKSSIVIAILAASTLAWAGKSYQVTGPVLEVTIDKKGEKFEIDRTPTTKITGDLKKGSKVTVFYTMSAQDIEVKGK